MPRNPIQVAALFALSGAASFGLVWAWDSLFYYAGSWVFNLDGIFFSVMAAYLFVPSRKLWGIVILLVDVVWIASAQSAAYLVANTHSNDYFSMAVGGAVGGLGVTLSVGLGSHRLLSLRSLALVTVVGSLAALPFTWWVRRDSKLSGFACFVVWQAMVGTTLWVRNSPIRELPGTAPNR